MDTFPGHQKPEQLREIMSVVEIVFSTLRIAEQLQVQDAHLPTARTVDFLITRDILDTVDRSTLESPLDTFIDDPDVYLELSYHTENLSERPSLSMRFIKSDDTQDSEVSYFELFRQGGPLTGDRGFTTRSSVTVEAETVAILLGEIIKPANVLVINDEGCTDLRSYSDPVVDPQAVVTSHEVEMTLREKGCNEVKIESYDLQNVDGSNYMVQITTESLDDHEQITRVRIINNDTAIGIVDGQMREFGQRTGYAIEITKLSHAIMPVLLDADGTERIDRNADIKSFDLVDFERQLRAIQEYLAQDGLYAPNTRA